MLSGSITSGASGVGVGLSFGGGGGSPKVGAMRSLPAARGVGVAVGAEVVLEVTGVPDWGGVVVGACVGVAVWLLRLGRESAV